MESKTQKNAALVQEFLTEVVGGEDIGALDIFLTDTAVDHHPFIEEDTPQLPAQGPAVCRLLGAADVSIAIDDIVAEGDMVAVRGTVTGTHQPSLVDVAATGRNFEISYAWFCRIEDGHIDEIWSLPDGRGLRRELGVPMDQPGPEERTQP